MNQFIGFSNANKKMANKKCSKPLGLAALVEPESSENPYAVLTQHNLPSPIPANR